MISRPEKLKSEKFMEDEFFYFTNIHCLSVDKVIVGNSNLISANKTTKYTHLNFQVFSEQVSDLPAARNQQCDGKESSFIQNSCEFRVFFTQT